VGKLCSLQVVPKVPIKDPNEVTRPRGVRLRLLRRANSGYS
jgi:hypothetical protein